MGKRYNNYKEKKDAQKGGSYEGNSPFFQNIPEFQYLKPLHRDVYPHLRQWKGFRLPSPPRPNYNTQNTHTHDEDTVV